MRSRRYWLVAGTVGGLLTGEAAVAQTVLPQHEAALRFGALEAVQDIALSPDGRRIVYVAPGVGRQTAAMVVTVEEAAAPARPRAVALANGNPGRLLDCGWASNDRVICRQYGVVATPQSEAAGIPIIRTVSINTDGKGSWQLGQRLNPYTTTRMSQFDGAVIDWGSGADGQVLMTRDYVPDSTTGTLIGQKHDGTGVARVDARDGRTTNVEGANPNASAYISDGRGNIRLMALESSASNGMLTGNVTWRYRKAGERGWTVFGVNRKDDKAAPEPIAVDPNLNVAYTRRSHEGREALYRVALDGTMHEELVYANPNVDIGDVITIGRNGRVVGVSYVTDRRQAKYFDPEYAKLAGSLSKALPGAPLVKFVGSNADETKLLLFAGSDVDPGTYFLFDRTARKLSPLLADRPGLEGVALANVQSITYKAADGTDIPAYLTMPPAAVGKPVGAIVMPHGGPASRDEWGFDWLAQYFAHRGFAVLQPNFRGSTGYGEAWFKDNGFKSWATAIGDVTAGVGYLTSKGIADSSHLAIVGWSYGGYAALQSAVVAPDLFKAVVAVAPVTDLAMLKQQARAFTSGSLVADYVGSGPHMHDGSPLQRAGSIRAPVLMFSGDRDINVDIGQARAMDKAIRGAGGKSELVTFSGLDHQLNDAGARTQLLERADAFIRSAMGIK